MTIASVKNRNSWDPTHNGAFNYQDMVAIERELVSGAQNVLAYVNFGAAGAGDPLSTNVDVMVKTDLLKGAPLATGKQCLEVFKMSMFSEAPVSNVALSNYVTPGVTRLSEISLVLPSNIVGIKLQKKSYEGSIPVVTVYWTAFVGNNDAETVAQVVKTLELKNCFVTFVDLFSYQSLNLISLACSEYIVRQADIKRVGTTGTNDVAGQYAYSFDYNSTSGKPPA